METLLDADDRFRIAEDNPEVMFDVLTMQSLRDKYTEKDILEVQLAAPYVNEQEFDNYVREFAIDDTISECFATSEESGSIFSLPFQKQMSSPLKQNRLKKKLNQKSPNEELILSDEESRSSDSKRSKLIGNIFSRNRKGKENIKPSKEPEVKDQTDITGQIINACEHITKTYKQKPETQSTDKSQKRDQNKNHTISPNNSIHSESSHATRRTSLGTRSRDSSSSRRLPPVPTDSSRSDSSVSRRKHSNSSSTGVTRRGPKKPEGLIDELMSKSDSDLASALHTIAYDAIRKTRDKCGNTVLHRCVEEDKPASTKLLSTRYPQMCSELNNDRLSPLEYSVKLGKCECMLILLEKSRSDGVLESLTVPRLLNMAALYDQPTCLEALLNLLPKGEGSPLDLPPDSMGNTAAHEAASKGHLRCLKILLDNGFDVWSKNSDNLCPIQLAIHNQHEECYGFMLLFESSRCLAREASGFYNKSVRLKNSKLANYDAFLQIECQLSRYQDQLNDAIRSTLESQEHILVTLDSIYDQLTAVLRGTDGNTEISSYIENIKGEAEHLQDLFDFSMIANANSLLSRLLIEFREILKDADGKDSKDTSPDFKPFTAFRTSYKEMLDGLEQSGGGTFQQDVSQHILSFIESHKLPEVHFSDKENASNSSSANSNRTFTITKKAIKLSGLSTESAKKESNPSISQTKLTGESSQNGTTTKSSLKRKSSSMGKQRDGDNLSSAKNDNIQNTSHLNDNVFVDADHTNMTAEIDSSQMVSLLESPSDSQSVYTSTLTSESTAVDKYSDWTSRSDTLKRESCESGSEWWHENHGYYEDEDDVVDGDDDDDERVRLNVDNEDLPDDMLRQHRLTQHLKSVQKITSQHNDVVETVVTASGRQLGRQNPSKIPTAAPRPSLNKEPVKQKEQKRVTNLFSRIRHKGKVKLFNADDVPQSREITESEFRESYDRSRETDNNDLKWDEVSLTDGEEYKTSEKPWYEMSEDEESLLQGWNTDEDDKRSRDLGHL